MAQNPLTLQNVNAPCNADGNNFLKREGRSSNLFFSYSTLKLKLGQYLTDYIQLFLLIIIFYMYI